MFKWLRPPGCVIILIRFALRPLPSAAAPLSLQGLTLQKLIHKQRETQQGPKKKVYKEGRWLLGCLCLLAGSLISLAVFALLGQSRASAMAAMTLVTNAIFARWLLKEPFTMADFGATALISECADRQERGRGIPQEQRGRETRDGAAPSLSLRPFPLSRPSLPAAAAAALSHIVAFTLPPPFSPLPSSLQ